MTDFKLITSPMANGWPTVSASPKAASYDIRFRIAGNNGAGSLRVELDGVDITGLVDIPATGGWQNWDDVIVTGVPMNAGEQQLRIVMVDAAYNINYLDITPSSQGVNQPPVAQAGADLVARDGDGDDSHQVSLDGSQSSDSDGSIASYAWTLDGE